MTRDTSSENMQFLADRATASGAFTLGEYGVAKGIYEASGSALYGYSHLGFDASNSAAIFGKSQTVQPAAIYALIIIKA